jgi:hypothetical protein
VQDPPALTHELLTWVASRRRTYAETVEAWRSNCPRHPALDDAFTDGLINVVRSEVVLTPQGRALLRRRIH